MFKEFGWSTQQCYDLSEPQIADIIKAMAPDPKPKARSTPTGADTHAGPGLTKPEAVKLTLNERVAIKARSLGRKLTQAELMALL